MSLSKRCFAEFFGTFWLVFGGCGAALISAAFPHLGIGFADVALFQGGWAVHQLWVFWLVPLIGGAVGGWIYGKLFDNE